MYTLLSGLYKYMFQKDEYCILILGLDNAGKTTFLEQSKTRFNKQYKGMSLSKITTTVGLNIGTVDVGKTRLMFWDLGGQEELQSLWDKLLWWTLHRHQGLYSLCLLLASAPGPVSMLSTSWHTCISGHDFSHKQGFLTWPEVCCICWRANVPFPSHWLSLSHSSCAW
ncbi:ADP-ribosylation factor-related protein 1 isoform X4 [Urocitellus parryii]